MQDSAFVPSTNLSETKHASWLASVGNKQMLNLYDACVSDLANALLQSAKMLAFVEGKYKGSGPSTDNLVRRLESRKYTPSRISTEIEETIQGIPMYRRPFVEGDNITISRKRKTIDIVLRKKRMQHTGQSTSHKTNHDIRSRHRSTEIKLPQRKKTSKMV